MGTHKKARKIFVWGFRLISANWIYCHNFQEHERKDSRKSPPYTPRRVFASFELWFSIRINWRKMYSIKCEPPTTQTNGTTHTHKQSPWIRYLHNVRSNCRYIATIVNLISIGVRQYCGLCIGFYELRLRSFGFRVFLRCRLNAYSTVLQHNMPIIG